jgi:hypothetical protein
MNHASVLWIAQERCDSGALYITALHPRGASGNLFQLYRLLIASLADFVGLRHEGCSMFRVFLTCGVKRSHSWRGNLLSVVARALIKCALKVCMCMACSAAFTRWLLGSARRLSHFLRVS